jgi:hypothetical protein
MEMPRINATINIQVGSTVQPLRRAYVEHIAAGFRVFGSQLYRTNDQGQVIDRQGNFGIDAIPNLLTNQIDIRVICHNSIVRIPNGILDHFIDFSISDGDTVAIQNANSSFDQFRILNRCAQVYSSVLQQFQVFSSDFPLGLFNSLDKTRESNRRIDVLFPDSLPQPLSFVEPKGLSTGYPVIHIKDTDPRLFGADRTLIPAELSHALHFSRLTDAQRQEIAVRYSSFIVSDFLSGGTSTHTMAADTDPTVAYIEAFDHFVHRFDRFIRANRNLSGANLRNGFIRSELNVVESFTDQSGIVLATRFGTLTGGLNTGTYTPDPAFLTSGPRSATSIEGSIYAAVFLDFARRPGVGLRTAVNAFVRSQALSFGEFRSWIHANRPNLRAQIDQVRSTWTL